MPQRAGDAGLDILRETRRLAQQGHGDAPLAKRGDSVIE
jgi:hypothetical protein